ncbi:hypothetical protein DFJ74DRAFT_766220 [Hyaloraphidium curvatum]|nr:hypothetical protein DFJ74DRAFT_766220 [Hyaloraphidium curvatum]
MLAFGCRRCASALPRAIRAAMPRDGARGDAAALVVPARPASTKREKKFKGVFMVLSEDVAELNARAGDVVAVSREASQRWLLPKKLARYVPLDSTGKPIWPEDFVARALEHARLLDEALGVTIRPESREAALKAAKTRELERALAQEAEQLRSLAGPLEFRRIESSEGSEGFFGSIGPADVAEALREKQIFVDESRIEGDRVRTFGPHFFAVNLGELGTMTISIIVAPEGSGPAPAASAEPADGRLTEDTEVVEEAEVADVAESAKTAETAQGAAEADRP